MKIGVVVQARMGSTRLSGKVLKTIGDKTILNHVIERLKQSKYTDAIVIATTVLKRDSLIEAEALRSGAFVFRGSEDDVLSRYYQAAKDNQLDVVVRVTSDCPLIDPIVLDEMINYYITHDFEIVTNVGNELSDRTFPRGLDIEIFSFNALENAYHNAHEPYHREHVTPYLYEKAEKIFYFKDDNDYSHYRWTVDTEEDFQLISEIYHYLYEGTHNFYLKDVINLFDEHPELVTINAHIEQKKIK